MRRFSMRHLMPFLGKPRFDAGAYEKLRAGFDADFYRRQSPRADWSDSVAFDHFLTRGWRQGLDPSTDFSVDAYLAFYPEVARSGENPLVHYLLKGRSTGYIAHRADVLKDISVAALDYVRPHFDADFYKRQTDQVTGSDEFALMHFMAYGWKQRLDPAGDFSTNYYLNANPDILEAGINPFLHFYMAGQAEGRRPRHEAPPDRDQELQAAAPFFDAEFYRATYGDIGGSDDDLLRHYLDIGWREGRDPAADFSTSYYLDTYDDIRAGDLNPLLHYALSGKTEGRRPMARGPVPLRQSADAGIVQDHLKCILGPPADEKLARLPKGHRINPKALDLHWIIPDFDRGGGGHMTIFRMIRHLEIFGHKCTIWIEQPRVHSSGDAAYQDIVKYFQCVQADVAFAQDGFAQATGDAVIATAWSTAYLAEAAQGFAGKYYFVQDHEIEFYPTGSERLMARRTYDFDFASICASPWLSDMMAEKYGRWARHFHLAYDHDEYHIEGPEAHQKRFQLISTDPVKIAVYARGHTARRCVDLALIALDILADRDLNIEVHFFGQESLPFTATRFKAFNHGVLEAAELADLYRDCDLGLCFSATNYSLVPQEMMACGLPVLELDTDSTRVIFPKGTVTLAGPDPSDIADKLADLITDPNARQVQAQEALAWVRQFTWENAACDVEAAIIAYLDQLKIPTSPPIGNARDTLMDVIIPTYNGIGQIEGVIAALRAQKHAHRMQIYCVDSSSTDGTTEWLRQQPDISTTVIEQADFQHGRTRNEAIALGSSPFIGVLTQDALPATNFWASDILKMMQHYPEAAGLFGRHLPYPHHPAFVRDEITSHFQNMLKKPLLVSKLTDELKWRKPDQGWHQFLHFYSDNNSAMRRSVWQDIPYPQIDYGEDQVWAYSIIKAGYSKIYAPSAAAYHSHDYSPDETYARSRIEGAFFHTHFGYELGNGTEKQVANRIAREQRNFRNWARKRDVGTQELDQRQRNIAEKYRGWRDGVSDSKAAFDVSPESKA